MMINPTRLLAEPNSTTITIERVFDAPRERVFRVFSNPETVARWWSPFGTARVEQYEPREGGRWRIADVMSEQEAITFFGYFHDLSFPERIVQTSEFANLPERGHAVLDRYEFRALEGGRTLMVLTEAFLTTSDRDAALESGMEPGIVQQYVNIDELLRATQGEKE
jgi:uncharacterized protein YndB with AHSA1/START domain